VQFIVDGSCSVHITNPERPELRRADMPLSGWSRPPGRDPRAHMPMTARSSVVRRLRVVPVRGLARTRGENEASATTKPARAQ
jgi:hypothetical protein